MKSLMFMLSVCCVTVMGILWIGLVVPTTPYVHIPMAGHRYAIITPVLGNRS